MGVHAMGGKQVQIPNVRAQTGREESAKPNGLALNEGMQRPNGRTRNGREGST
jgi:hypothetical protein